MKHLVDLDEAALDAARRRLGTKTIKDTVNAALHVVAGQDAEAHGVDAALDRLARFPFEDRTQAWR